MENFDENLENEYRKRFENFDEMPDDMLWEKIQARIKPEKERPFVVWWNNMRSPAMRGPIGIAASVLIGLLIGVYFFVKTDNTQPLGDLPEKSDTSASQPKNPDVTQKVNPAESETKSTDKIGNSIANESHSLASTKTSKDKTAIDESNQALKNKQLPTVSKENNDAIAQTPVEKKTANTEENKPEVIVNPITAKPETMPSVIAESNQIEEEKAVLAQNTEKKVNKDATTVAEEKAGETKVALSTKLENAMPNGAIVKNEPSEVFGVKDTLFQNMQINSLNRKEAQQLAVTGKKPEAPELPEAEMPMVEEERRRLVFIPPSEIFANVTSTLSYYMFSPNKGDKIMVNNFSSSSQRLGFAAQLGFVYPIARKMDLRTGLSYFQGKSRISYGVTDDSQKSITVLNNNSIQINPGKSTKDENRNWQYLELQSDVLYEVKKMQALSLGMKFGVQTSAVNKPLLQARLGYRVSKAIADHWALWLEPTVSVSLSSHQALENLFMYRTTGFGLNMGVSLLR
ncbi:outer membrane beta-barrel protein [Emticicia agri]|uniref:Uncharacterized protein n=1 Tax=Emticicia agri TaxID=2492393 RepID=A0A4Q5LWQ0_9BACT|nr:outer membrane beta-barrel protein [Emticicia agri]RYU93967.1 hypothetical protein EWM59_19600 [Emticicia agri]